MGNLFAHRKFLVTVAKVEEDGKLLTPTGEIPVNKGNIIAHDEFGSPFVMTQERFSEYYVPVERVETKRVKEKSPFEIEYEKALIEFNQLELNSEEDESYINELKDLSDNKQY